ncbi:fasciclin domain-containing protein, partial [Klebsiella pneumoniae]|nr:fasciclin domain-containing protein [Klebsiella pneumoniae]
RVLLPPAGNLAEIAVANPNLTYLVAALQRAGLVQTIATGGPFTVFAPTNAAFQAAGFPTIASIQSADPAVLTRILTYHVLNERAFAAGLRTNA